MDKHVDEQLTRLISDAVADVEPSDRLAEIRERTSPRRTRRGWYAAGGATLAAAAAVTAIALAGNQDGPRADDPGPLASQSTDPTPTAGTSAYPVYYIGATPMGLRLYREFHRTTPVGPGELLESPPLDPDYSTPWPEGSFGEVSVRTDGGVASQIDVTIAKESLHDRPPGMSQAKAELAIQQVIYTVQAVLQQRLPVQFRLNGNPVDQVLGVPTSEPLTHAPQLEVLSLVNISDPGEGVEVEDLFIATGVANSFEATVPWEIRSGDEVLMKSFASTEGSMGQRLFPWRTEVDVSGLQPGSYTFVAQTSDPSDGEGPGPFEDTRTIVVR